MTLSDRVVAALGHLAKVVDERLEFGPLRGEECFAVECGGEFLIFGGHRPSIDLLGAASGAGRRSERLERLQPDHSSVL